MKKLKQAKAEAKTDLEKLTTEHEAKYKDIEVKELNISYVMVDLVWHLFWGMKQEYIVVINVERGNVCIWEISL